MSVWTSQAALLRVASLLLRVDGPVSELAVCPVRRSALPGYAAARRLVAGPEVPLVSTPGACATGQRRRRPRRCDSPKGIVHDGAGYMRTSQPRSERKQAKNKVPDDLPNGVEARLTLYREDLYATRGQSSPQDVSILMTETRLTKRMESNAIVELHIARPRDVHRSLTAVMSDDWEAGCVSVLVATRSARHGSSCQEKSFVHFILQLLLGGRACHNSWAVNTH
ncbi:hypothetical protein IWZ00DRAFT_488340 [Phyllosticta capitalensis]